MQLRHDTVLVVPRIADERPAIRPAGDLAGLGVEGVPRHRLAQQHVDPVRVVQVRLVVRPAPVQVVQVEAGGAEVRQGVELRRVQGLPQPGCGVEGEVMVDELAQVGVGGRYLAVLLGIALRVSGGPGCLLSGSSSRPVAARSCQSTGSVFSGSSLMKRPAIRSSGASSWCWSHHVPWNNPVILALPRSCAPVLEQAAMAAGSSGLRRLNCPRRGR